MHDEQKNLTAVELNDVAELLATERPDLLRFVARRLNSRLKARVDASDIVQETFREAHRRFADYVGKRPMPFDAWLRKLAYDRVNMELRRHIGAAQRSVKREALICDDSEILCAERFVADDTSPSGKLQRKERVLAVRNALETLETIDREILCLRMVDELPYEEIAGILDLEPATARKRYGRALVKLGDALGTPEKFL